MNLNYTLTEEEVLEICKLNFNPMSNELKKLILSQSLAFLLLFIICSKRFNFNFNIFFTAIFIIFSIISFKITHKKVSDIFLNKIYSNHEKNSKLSDSDFSNKSLVINTHSVILSSKLSTTQIFLNSIKQVKIKDKFIILNTIHIPIRLFDTEESLKQFIDFLNDSIDNSKNNLKFDLEEPEYTSNLITYAPYKIYYYSKLYGIITFITFCLFLFTCFVYNLVTYSLLDSYDICLIFIIALFILAAISYFLLLTSRLKNEKYFLNSSKLKKNYYPPYIFRSYIKNDYIYLVESRKGQDISIQKSHISTYSKIEEKGNFLSLNDGYLLIHKNSFESIKDKNKFIEFFNN